MLSFGQDQQACKVLLC